MTMPMRAWPTEQPTPETVEEPHRWLWSRDLYSLAAERGVFGPDEHLELIEGEVFTNMSPIGSKHMACLLRSNRTLVRICGDRFSVCPGPAIALSNTSEPQPDLCLLVPKDDDYKSGNPSASDVRLLIEISDSTLRFDRGRKADLYGRHGITEYWILNIMDDQVEIYRDPDPVSGYRTLSVFGKTEAVEALCLPDEAIPVKDLISTGDT